ncbi:T9SS type A sorting domain-containing protein, partial [Flavisolibacter sp. BT320]|nr:T9SS type A sorting domain-containing protein [Flavisolibacter longurius]
MVQIYATLKRSLFLSALVLGGNAVIAQGPCTTVVEDFDNTSGSTAGFTGELGITTTGIDGYLQKDKVLPTVAYSVTTPTYVLPNAATSVLFGFELGGTQQVGKINILISFRSTLNNEIVNVLLAEVTPTYSGGVANVCQTVSLAGLPGFPAGGQYRLNYSLVSASGTGAVGQTITFDDFQTNGTISQAALPVTFIGFDAKKLGNSVLLTWKIAGEENVARYEVERSEDGRSYTRIGQIQSHGKDIYNFSDDAPVASAYYRIKNVDNDGAFKYSSIARISGGRSSIVLKAFPQPVANTLTLQHPSYDGKTSISIANAEGRVVRNIQPASGSIQTTVDMSSLGKGMYFIRVSQENGTTETLKV